MQPPCRRCERKGCGAYHQECVPYQAYVNEKKKRVEKAMVMSDVNYYLIDRVKMSAIKRRKKEKR